MREAISGKQSMSGGQWQQSCERPVISLSMTDTAAGGYRAQVQIQGSWQGGSAQIRILESGLDSAFTSNLRFSVGPRRCKGSSY